MVEIKELFANFVGRRVSFQKISKVNQYDSEEDGRGLGFIKRIFHYTFVPHVFFVFQNFIFFVRFLFYEAYKIIRPLRIQFGLAIFCNLF